MDFSRRAEKIPYHLLLRLVENEPEPGPEPMDVVALAVAQNIGQGF